MFFHGSIFFSVPAAPFPQSPRVAGSGIKQTHSCVRHLSWQQGTQPRTWLELKRNPSKVHRSTQPLRPAAGFYRTGEKQGLSACQPSRSNIPPVPPEVGLYWPKVSFLHQKWLRARRTSLFVGRCVWRQTPRRDLHPAHSSFVGSSA